MDDFKYSVLMSVYYKEKPEYLRESILSMLNQSVQPNEIVLVKDGPLTEELEGIIDGFKNDPIIRIIPLRENVGLGKALNIGVRECKNKLIARMDTDDISNIDRCQKQLEMFKKDKELSVVGTAIEEFIGQPNNIVAYKEVKVLDKEIKKQMKCRNAINHPSVMFKKEDVLKSDNYQDWFLNEDYYLWIRMSVEDFKFYNINEPLVKMRITDETYLRRGGWKYFITQKRLFDYMFKCNFINSFEYIYNNLIRFGMRVLIPNKIRKILYLNILRRKT